MRLLFLCLLAALLRFISPSLAAETGRDAFGGSEAIKLPAKGFSYPLQQESRWWLVTPAGHGYRFAGMVHATPHLLRQPHNAAHWSQQLQVSNDADKGARLSAFWSKLKSDQQRLGFTGMHHSQEPEAGQAFVPYIGRCRTVMNNYFASPKPPEFPDVFAPEFEERCQLTAKTMAAPRADDPWLIGWFFTDCPVMGEEDALPFAPGIFHTRRSECMTWQRTLRNLPASAPGKQTYVKLMRERHTNSVEHFNATYNTAFKSFDDLLAATDWRIRADYTGNSVEDADNAAFLLLILDRSWTVQRDAVRSVDANHLLFGDVLNVNHPLPDAVIRLHARHFPVTLYQYYGTPADHQRVRERMASLTGHAVLCVDSSWSTPKPPQMPDPLGPQCATAEVRAQRLTEALTDAYSHPSSLGWGWCGWMDAWAATEGDMQHSGLQDPFGKWDEAVANAYSDVNRRLYELATQR